MIDFRELKSRIGAAMHALKEPHVYVAWIGKKDGVRNDFVCYISEEGYNVLFLDTVAQSSSAIGLAVHNAGEHGERFTFNSKKEIPLDK
jgi:phage gp37-like protein